jgi:hypothetical protein
VGDIVEVQLSLEMAYDGRDRKFKLFCTLRALTLLDNSFSQVSIIQTCERLPHLTLFVESKSSSYASTSSNFQDS